MKWSLGDTTADGVRFLLLGAGALLVMRLLFAGFDHWLNAHPADELAAAIAPFRSGYLSTSTHKLVTDGGEVSTRLAMAIPSSIGAALLTALAIFLCCKVLRKPHQRATSLALRLTLVVALVWFMNAALFIPPRTVLINTQGLDLLTRPALFDRLSLPTPATREHLTWTQVDTILSTTQLRSHTQHMDQAVMVRAGTRDFHLVSADQRSAERLVTALERLRDPY